MGPVLSRDALYAGLFDLLAAAYPFKTKSRRLRHWKDVPVDKQAALFLAVTDQDQRSPAGVPADWALHAEATVYVHDDSKDGVPQAALNAVLDAIEAALAPDDPETERFTLGGLVRDCRIQGIVETDKGTLGPQAVAIVPLVILPKLTD